MDKKPTLVNIRDSLNREYYDSGDSGVSDELYDAISEALGGEKTLCAPPSGSGWQIREHLVPMSGISLVARNIEEWVSMVESGNIGDEGWASNKFDGLSIELQYANGSLVAAVLRGDGINGEDVLRNARRCRGVPASIRQTGTWSVRGEVVCSGNNLTIINESREVPYATRRHAVSMVRSTTLMPQVASLLAIVAIDVVEVTSSGPRVVDMTELETWLTANRFLIVKQMRATAAGAWRARNALIRDPMDFQYDGLVFRDDRGRIAKLKPEPMMALTTVVGIVEQLGRTGVVTPVCELEPIRLLGSMVRRATAHNVELIGRDLVGLGPGAVVAVALRGDVIPHVERVMVASDHPWSPSGVCPSCGCPTLREGAISRCSSDPDQCPGTAVGLMRKFCVELGIKLLSGSTMAALFTAGVDLPHKLYEMDETWLASVEVGGSRIGQTRAASIIREISSRSEMTFGELLGAVGVPGCAGSVMQLVADAFPDPESLETLDVEDLLPIDGIGPARARSIAAFMDTRYAAVVEPLLERIRIRPPGGSLAGKSFCITLGLRSGSREQVEAMIRRHGGVVKSSVSRDLTYLVCNTPSETTTKLTRAKELGTPIISEDELMIMMGSVFVEPDPSSNDDF